MLYCGCSVAVLVVVRDAAYLAGLAVGVWRNKEELKTAWKLDVRFEPVMAEVEAAKLYKGWRKAVKHAMHWLDDEE